MQRECELCSSSLITLFLYELSGDKHTYKKHISVRCHCVWRFFTQFPSPLISEYFRDFYRNYLKTMEIYKKHRVLLICLIFTFFVKKHRIPCLFIDVFVILLKSCKSVEFGWNGGSGLKRRLKASWTEKYTKNIDFRNFQFVFVICVERHGIPLILTIFCEFIEIVWKT